MVEENLLYHLFGTSGRAPPNRLAQAASPSCGAPCCPFPGKQASGPAIENTAVDLIDLVH